MTTRPPRIALFTTCGDRLAWLRKTLPANIADNRDYPDAVHVLLDYGSRDGLQDYVREVHGADLASGRLVYYYHPSPAPHFLMAHSRNMAIRCAMLEEPCPDIFANIDADNWTGKGFASFVAESFERANDAHESIFMRPRQNHEGPGHDVGSRAGSGVHGRIVVSRGAFFEAGGYDEVFKFWSPDDLDFAARLERLGYQRHGIPSQYLRAIWHDNDVRFAIKANGAPKDWGDGHSLGGREALTCVNEGHIGEGVVFRNFARAPILIRRMATRIFGVGWHGTATRSLASALRELGFSCAHWESAAWARRVLEEIEVAGRSRALDAYYAACDAPIPLIYRELDKVYPGSKFVLTIRDPDQWLASIEKKWKAERDTWLHDGGSDFVHFRMYGRTDFHPDRWAQAYRLHNERVLDYFSGRNDLLVMDMSAGAGWAELCRFLEIPTPATPYPREPKPRPPSQ
jgi:hypothetical protein